MKCHVCNNNGGKFAFAMCFGGSIYINRWVDEEEFDEYDADELVLITCGNCKFTGLPGMFEDELVLPEIKKDEHGPYIDNFSVGIGLGTVRGKLYLNEEVADKCMRLYMILTATSVDQLPEGLVDEVPEFRKVAATRFAKFELGDEYNE